MKQKQTGMVETQESESQGIFTVLNSSYSIDEMEIRQNSEGAVYVQDPDGTVAEVKQQLNGLRAEEVEPESVNLDGMDEVEDVFSDSIVHKIHYVIVAEATEETINIFNQLLLTGPSVFGKIHEVRLKV